MNIVAMDDEELSLWRLERELKKVFPDDNIISVQEIPELMTCIKQKEKNGEDIDFAFMDIQLANGTGLDMAQRLRSSFPHIKIVFCTAFPEYTMDAFSIYANGYLLKPIKSENISRLVTTLLPSLHENGQRVVIHTFGNFDVFVDGKLLVFTKRKVKELLAYLVDRNGASVSSAEIGAVLWEDQPEGDILRDRVQHVKKDLRDMLEEKGIGDILVCGWNSLAVNKQKISCDYYDFLRGDTAAMQNYMGEYMKNYSWAEETAGTLWNLMKT